MPAIVTVLAMFKSALSRHTSQLLAIAGRAVAITTATGLARILRTTAADPGCLA